MKKFITHSFLALNLITFTETCYGAGWFSRLLETEKQKLARAINPPLLTVVEKEREQIKTKSQGPTKKVRRENTTTISISATAMREAGSFQKEYKEKNNDDDGRVQVTETDEWPYSVHGAVFASFSNGSKKWGTGTLIAHNLVLTAAHNLYDIDEKHEATKIEFCPAMNGDKIYFGKLEAIKHYFPKEYKISGDFSLDYGLLLLNRTVGQETGYFGLGIISEDTLKSESINITGYPMDKVHDKSEWYEMWTMEGLVKNIQNGLINYTINTYRGQSGAGIWYQDGENYLVAGVHVAGNEGFNSAVLLTRERYNQITTWVEDSISEQISRRMLDGLFLDVTTVNLLTKDVDFTTVEFFTSDRFPNLTSLNLSGGESRFHSEFGINDSNAIELAKLTNLTKLDLEDNKIGDAGAMGLARLTNLRELSLGRNNIGNAGANQLARLTNLTRLDLNGNRVGDTGAKELAKLTSLTRLNLNDNKVSEEGKRVLCSNSHIKDLQVNVNSCSIQ